ncbi:MOSC domain-containing protein [uncultured Cohaesibacter sp.]|uniref:MOSC domain-containing protein n=1 Tax=uncultured Cohaesibacter sp. TaxID=1002546 RepID=UPI0029C8D1F5|nr:MOSC N-terminal beta barrel domain-containing protein [uncultured Cohaesibacter sp.]
MTITLSAIYRYPIKGFSPQSLESVDVTKGAPLPWDRAFAIENGPSGFDPQSPAHLSKIHFLMLMKQPELAALRTSFDPETGALSVALHGELKAEGNLFDGGDMSEVIAYLQTYVQKPMRGAPKLLHANGHAFTDSSTQDISLINLASVRAIGEKAGAELDPIRFRGNLYIEGADSWQEHDWVGREVTIGEVTFHVRKRTERCAATNANPETGERDQQIPKLLMTHFDHTDCGIHLMPLTSGVIRPGDSLTL